MKHLTEIPEGLLERWRKFAEEVRICWEKAHEKVGPNAPAEELFEAYFECMRKGAFHNIPPEKAIAAGVSPHPACVIAKMYKKGISKPEAMLECLKEGKYHPISVLMAKIKGLL